MSDRTRELIFWLVLGSLFRVHGLGGTKAEEPGRTAAGLPTRGRFKDPHRYPRTRCRFRYRSAGLATSSHLGMRTKGIE